MFNSNKCCFKNVLYFAWKYLKPGGIWNIEILVVQISYYFVSIFFPENLKFWHQKKGFGTGHQDIGQKL